MCRPKYIYLDQNKWIELAKGIKQGEPLYIKLKAKIDKKIQADEWAFPISIIHLAETIKRQNEDSRNDIFDLMYDLSNGYSICDGSTADILEFDYWINNNLKMNHAALESTIVTEDYANIIGLSNDTIFNNAFEAEGSISPISPETLEFASAFKDVFKKSKQLIKMLAQRALELSKDESEYLNLLMTEKSDYDEWLSEIRLTDVFKENLVFPAATINRFYKLYRKKLQALPPAKKVALKTIILFICTSKTFPVLMYIINCFKTYLQLKIELYMLMTFLI